MVFCNTDTEYGVYEPISSHNPYFNRWFSAIKLITSFKLSDTSHNPYFNRWFSAICPVDIDEFIKGKSQSLF